MDILKTFFDLLTPRERRNLSLLFGAVLVMAGLEVVSVGSILPFLQVAADPASVQENAYLSWIYETFGFADTHTFLIALGLGALTALVGSNAFIVFTTWMLYRYVWGRNHGISWRLLRSYLNRPYEYFLTRNSAELGKNILDEVREVAGGMLLPALRAGAKAIVVFFIAGFLFFVDPTVALMVTMVLGLAYMGVYYAVRDRLDRIGEERVKVNTMRYQFVSEAFSSIKQVKLRGKEEMFLEQYEDPSERFAQVQAHYRVIKRAPRYILEAVAFGGIVLIAVYLIAVQENFRQVIPMLGLYAFAGYRVMPALQHVFKGIASARFNIAALETICRGLQERAAPQVSANGPLDSINRPLTLDNRLVMDDVSYTYPAAEESAIRELSLEIPAHTTLGFVGKTGSGKTTAIDLILGLLRPQKGIVSVDGTPLRGDDTIRQWQEEVGCVPQQVNLLDSTVMRNIAFGVPEENIDMDAVYHAARQARIYEFIVEHLPNQWYTEIGERGVKLSGGQRQRLGIARALYHRPSVLVFDEGTSALDQATEAKVLEAIYGLEGKHTLIMIAHRLSTVKKADKIIMLHQGSKMGEGSYQRLKKNNSEFQSMAFS